MSPFLFAGFLVFIVHTVCELTFAVFAVREPSANNSVREYLSKAHALKIFSNKRSQPCPINMISTYTTHHFEHLETADHRTGKVPTSSVKVEYPWSQADTCGGLASRSKVGLFRPLRDFLSANHYSQTSRQEQNWTWFANFDTNSKKSTQLHYFY